jgi:hypothetical protein
VIDTAVIERVTLGGRASATIEGRWSGGSELGSIPFLVGLGDAESTDVAIDEFTWIDTNGEPLDIDVERRSGGVALLDICRVGGARLVDPTGEVTLKMLGANPATGIAEIEVELTEDGSGTLHISDINGRRVAALETISWGRGSRIVSIDTGPLATGVYFIVLQTPTIRRMLRLEVRR